MVNRMNYGVVLNQGPGPGPGPDDIPGPPPVRESMLDRMNNGGGNGGRGPPPRPQYAQQHNGHWYHD